MSTLLRALHERKKLLQNPYAFVDELDQIESMKRDRARLENPYAHINELAETTRTVARFDSLAVPKPLAPNGNHRRSDSQLEDFVRDVQLKLWAERAKLFGNRNLDPIDVLDPAVALKSLGFHLTMVDSLGQFSTKGSTFEVAATIDKRKQLVEVSRQFNLASLQFTLAHELGHALLHETAELHRDRALDGSGAVLDPDEREANRFATLFLMPARQVRRVLEQNLGFVPVRVDERALFAGKVTRGANIKRLVARHIANLSQFNGVRFVPLAERFHVSIETMAIRLEELELFVLSDNLKGRAA
jgi:Zn-dependent peptidase ImmA (M78 family)